MQPTSLGISRFSGSRPQCKCHISPLSGVLSRRRVIKVLAAQKGSPWSTGPDASKGSSSKSSKKTSSSSSSNKKGPSKGSKSSTKPGKSSSSSKVPSGQGFGPSKATKPEVPLYKLTPPLTPQLLDELSGWEMVPAPLWGTFTGHCEGEWLGQYSAYTPWGGDPEAVWADESGQYLLYAYSRASEGRQQMPVGAFTAADDAAAGLEAAAAAAGDSEYGSAAAAAGEEDEELVDMLVRTTTRSASISSLIGGMSASKASAAAAAEREAAAAVGGAAAAAAAPVAAEDDETEGFAYNRDGSVVFNGGSYSVGPELIGAPELDDDLVADYQAALSSSNGGEDADEATAELLASLPYSTVVMEQALVAGGDTRLRLVATLKLRQPPGEQELDVEVARLLLYKEHWYGTAESTSGTARQSQAAAGSSSGSSSGSSHVLQLVPAHRFDVPVISMSRPQPSQLAGSWNVFVVAANPITEENPDTLQEEEVLVYSSREERQQWHVPGITSSAALGSSIPAGSSTAGSSTSQESGDGSATTAAAAAAAAAEELDDDGSGGSFWLPAGAIATFRMVPLSSSSSSSSSSSADGDDGYSGNGNGVTSTAAVAQRGLLVAFHWLVDDGSCLFVERQYDADGQLAETRHGTAVKGGWSGGRM